MEAVLGWFGALMDAIRSFLPAWHHLEKTDVGVTITRGSKVKVLRPGIVFYWPFWTSLYYRAANTQTEKLPPQSLMTRDQPPTRVTAGGMVRYKVTDPVLALVETDDVNTAIVDESLAVFCEWITSRELAEVMRTRRSDVNTSLTRAVRSSLRPYGVFVIRAQLTDYSLCTTLNHVGLTGGNANGEE